MVVQAVTDAIDHSDAYFSDRGISVDRRGTLIIDGTSDWGQNIAIQTLSHDTATNELVDRPVVVKAGARIMSNSLLYNCTIEEGAIVAFGCVVRSRTVPAHTMVEGNPARIIAVELISGWKWLVTPISIDEYRVQCKQL